jgi:hypothetical protein
MAVERRKFLKTAAMALAAEAPQKAAPRTVFNAIQMARTPSSTWASSDASTWFRTRLPLTP